MKKIVIAGGVVLWIVSVLFLGLVGYFYFVVFGNNDQTLAINLPVTNEWNEITINPPVKPSYNHQAIYIRPVGYVFDKDAKSFDIRLPDGTVVKPEVEVYAASGEVFEMHQKGFTLGHKGSDFADFSPANKLPSDRTYTKFRIRSDVPFVCERIEWIDYSPP